MDNKIDIPMAVIKRMPKYFRYLEDLLRGNISIISSRELSVKIGFTSSQIRQDLNSFGEFGSRGYGYNVQELYEQVKGILGLYKEHKVIIIGAGNIGQALANYSRLEKLRVRLEAIFDANPKLIGISINDVEIRDVGTLDSYLSENMIDICIICVPCSQVEGIKDILVKHKVKGIWNFSPVDIDIPGGIITENVHFSDSLLTLTCLLNEQQGRQEQKESEDRIA
jgi:redox-sensing transcriptional repressor